MPGFNLSVTVLTGEGIDRATEKCPCIIVPLSQKSKVLVAVTEIKGVVEDAFSMRPQMTQVLYFYCLASKSGVLETMETHKMESFSTW